MRRRLVVTTKKTLFHLYLSLIQPKLEYAIMAVGAVRDQIIGLDETKKN